MIENRTFDEIEVGDTASVTRTLEPEDIQLFALVSGDVNPAHLDAQYAATDMFRHVIAHGMWGGGLISAVLGTQLPGPGTIYLDQSLRFRRPVAPGDTITASVTVVEKRAEKKILILDCRCANQHGEDVITGQAQVIAPGEKVLRPRAELPDVRLNDHDKYRRLMELAGGSDPVPTAIVHPCSEAAITAALDAAQAGLIAPILIGPDAKIKAAATAASRAIDGFRIVPVAHSHAAAAKAVELVRTGEAQLVMKGSLHTDELMGAVVSSATGLRTERRISHAYVMDVPGRPTPLIITDAAINIAPSLEEKADIIRNAIDLAHVIGMEAPKVAILAAVETVNPAMPSTLDAAALCKMADQRRHSRWTPRLRQCGQRGRGQGKGYRFRSCGPCGNSGRAQPRSREHAGQAAHIPGRRRRGRYRAWRARAEHPDEPCRQPAHASRVLRSGGADGARRDAGSPWIARGQECMKAVVSLNSGSSSIKFSLFAMEPGGSLQLAAGGKIEKIGIVPALKARRTDGTILLDRTWPDGAGLTHADLLADLFSWAMQHPLEGYEIAAIGHRIVHGGTEFSVPRRIDSELIDKLEALCPLAPLHQPHNLAAVRAITKLDPDLPQVACFDTAFHHDKPALASRFAIPRALHDQGIRRYGFHGLSYEYIARRLAAIDPALASGKVIAAHLGNGASLCAMAAGQSVDTTMGFTALDGLMMGSRSGSLDPGVVLHLMTQMGMGAKTIEDMLYRQSGLLGVSGISSDMRTLAASDAPEAKEAIDLFAWRVARDTGALAASLEGVDGIIFTAGIGENDAGMRSLIGRRLQWLGLEIDDRANAAGETLISAPESRIKALVIPTDEERMIAIHTLSLLQETAQ